MSTLVGDCGCHKLVVMTLIGIAHISLTVIEKAGSISGLRQYLAFIGSLGSNC